MNEVESPPVIVLPCTQSCAKTTLHLILISCTVTPCLFCHVLISSLLLLFLCVDDWSLSAATLSRIRVLLRQFDLCYLVPEALPCCCSRICAETVAVRCGGLRGGVGVHGAVPEQGMWDALCLSRQVLDITVPVLSQWRDKNGAVRSCSESVLKPKRLLCVYPIHCQKQTLAHIDVTVPCLLYSSK